jgi:hypothetical protein
MLTVDRPRFRDDLVAESVEEGGHKFIDVGDPDSGSMFRLYEAEFSIACGMDGERDVAGIVQWAKDELGLMPSVNEVRNVISTLGTLGYLEQAAAARAAATERPAPAAAATELAQGIVVGAQRKPAAASIDVELGSAGVTAAAASTPLPKGGDVELGAPGAATVAKPPRAPVENVDLGAPGARQPQVAKHTSDVSLDLADHVPVKPADVKEALRQSKQMQAVEVPKELLEAEAPVPPKGQPVEKVTASTKPVAVPAVTAEKPAVVEKPVAAKPPVSEKPVEKPIEKKPVAVEKKPVSEKPVVVAEKKPTAPPAPAQGVSPILIILLVLAVGGAGAYFAWRYVIRKSDPTEAPPKQGSAVGSAGSAAVPLTPPKPPPPKGKIEIASGADRDIVAVFPGPVETIDVNPRDVESSDIIAKLQNAKRLEGVMANQDKEIEKRKTALTAARDAREKLSTPEGSGSAAPANEDKIKRADDAVDKASKALEDKQNERAKTEEDLEKLYVRAPFEGKITVVAKQGQKLEENGVVAKITPAPMPTALFKLSKNAILERGLAVPVRANEKMYTCEVSESTVDGTRVVCRQNAEGLTEGLDVTLMVEQE